jgi:hypothetical protein
VRHAQEVRSLLGDELRATVPKMVLLEQVSGLSGVAEEALPGAPLRVVRGAWSRVGGACGSVRVFRTWLQEFQVEAKVGAIRLSEESLEPAFRRLEQLAVDNGVGTAMARTLLEELVGLKLPLVWAYGDAHPSNILVKDGLVSGLVDWEGCRREQLPTSDWFQFVLSLAIEMVKSTSPTAMTARDAARAGSQSLIASPDDELSRTLQEETGRYLEAIGVDRSLAPLLYLLFLLDYYWSDHGDDMAGEVVASLAARSGAVV